jgi:hypothetical protein
MSDASAGAPDPSLEEEQPDYVRLTVLSCILLVLVGVFVYKRFIDPPKKPFYTDLPGINLSAMDPRVRQQVLTAANTTECGCGLPNCTYNVAECRHMDPGCDNSLRRAAEIVQGITGKQAVLAAPPAASGGAATAAPHGTLPAQPAPQPTLAPALTPSQGLPPGSAASTPSPLPPTNRP